MQGVEGMEKLFLGGIFSRDELNVIDEQYIHLTVFLPESCCRLGADSIDQVVSELF